MNAVWENCNFTHCWLHQNNEALNVWTKSLIGWKKWIKSNNRNQKKEINHEMINRVVVNTGWFHWSNSNSKIIYWFCNIIIHRIIRMNLLEQTKEKTNEQRQQSIIRFTKTNKFDEIAEMFTMEITISHHYLIFQLRKMLNTFNFRWWCGRTIIIIA